jgi:hypothetical protein
VAKLHIFGPIYPNLAKLHIFATNVSNRSRQFHFKIISGAIVYIVGDQHPAKKITNRGTKNILASKQVQLWYLLSSKNLVS